MGQGVAAACLLGLSACVNMGGIDLAPKYHGDRYVVPAKWNGESPFVQATPSDAAVRKDWWALFDDPVLNQLQQRAMEANPSLQAAAERFVQARDEMMKSRSKLIPKVGLGVDVSANRESEDKLFRSSTAPAYDHGVSLGGLASWEPDFWSKLRNETKVQIFRAEERAAQYALARLGIQAELAATYFTLRSLDAQEAIYRQSITYYQESLDLVTIKFKGLIAPELDVARAQYQLSNTQARLLGILGRRQVAEHALAVLTNTPPASFGIDPKPDLNVAQFAVPQVVPSLLLQRRPDVAAMERKMAQANKAIGIARAAFFPNIPLSATGGMEGHFVKFFRVPNFFWSVGSFVRFPAFTGGYRRAALQQAWSTFRETEHEYRGTLLHAFREVEDGLSLTRLLGEELGQQQQAVAAATRQQDLSMELYRGGLASSLDLINAQVNTLESRITSVQLRADLLRASVGLVRALGGGWSREDLPGDDKVQPFGVFQYANLKKPEPAGDIDVTVDEGNVELTAPVHY